MAIDLYPYPLFTEELATLPAGLRIKEKRNQWVNHVINNYPPTVFRDRLDDTAILTPISIGRKSTMPRRDYIQLLEVTRRIYESCKRSGCPWFGMYASGNSIDDNEIKGNSIDDNEPKARVYIVGSLRNPKVMEYANILREAGHYVFDDWMAAGPEADDYWLKYEKQKGVTMEQALRSKAAQHVLSFDATNMMDCDAIVLAMPAGKSGHLELGWAIGKGKRGFVLLDGEPDRWDVMYAFTEKVCTSIEELVEAL